MICQNCKADVDDDLIFCTNCGVRLFETKSEAPTVLINEPSATKPDNTRPPTVLMSDSVATRVQNVGAPPKPSSNLKWVALIIALIAIPASIFGIFLLTRPKNQPVAANSMKTATPTASPTRSNKANANQNSNAGAVNAGSNPANVNASPSPTPKPNEKTEIMNERIEIAPGEHYDLPFEIETETARLTGQVSVLQGGKIDVYVYLKSEFDEYFPDPVHKVSHFETGKTEAVNQTLVEQTYVMAFVNDTDKPIVIQGNFKLE